MASAAARLLRAYATQVEALRRLRNGNSQTVRVEHVHVNEGGQALIGNVRKPRSFAIDDLYGRLSAPASRALTKSPGFRQDSIPNHKI